LVEERVFCMAGFGRSRGGVVIVVVVVVVFIVVVVIVQWVLRERIGC
jgi:hypothetical protein